MSGFEWDEQKRLLNVQRHEIDFLRAKEIWEGPVIESLSRQTHHGEQRFVATGLLNEKLVTVIYTWRGENRRIISARAARPNERENYRKKTG
jgi:uncharacterized DUF497 family protein